MSETVHMVDGTLNAYSSGWTKTGILERSQYHAGSESSYGLRDDGLHWDMYGTVAPPPDGFTDSLNTDIGTLTTIPTTPGTPHYMYDAHWNKRTDTRSAFSSSGLSWPDLSLLSVLCIRTISSRRNGLGEPRCLRRAIGRAAASGKILPGTRDKLLSLLSDPAGMGKLVALFGGAAALHAYLPEVAVTCQRAD